MLRRTTSADHPDARRGLSQRFFSWMYSGMDGDPEFYDRAVSDYKEWLFKDLRGTVAEIGAGSGANFPYYPYGVHWIGIEPNVFMQDALMKMAAKHGIEGELRTGVAEHLELEDNSVDALVSTLVLCSVRDQDHTLREILRVLKPGGKFLFIEHVAAPRNSGLYRVQKLIKPVWKAVADGCNTDRETAAAIERAGFSSVEIKAFRAPLAVVSPHIAGKAIK